MATINYNFYDVNDYYSDGDIEDNIIKYIDENLENYESVFKNDSSWPVVYHLSDARKNIISWYPFKKDCTILEVGAGMGAITDELCKHAKKVTSIELSKRRAISIYKRNKDKENLEIIVGNYNKIEFNEKYDYILLNGVLEYGALYIDSDNPYIDLINSLKSHLNKNGKILIAIENKYGVKYWCGADEDHTGKIFEGIRDYSESHKVKTFSKSELEMLANTCGFKVNFYYVFPDYKFPELIYTDKSLEKGIYNNYTPYYCNKMSLIINEKKLYNEIYSNKEIPFFANSYFLELSKEQLDIEIEYIKFNNYRNKKYNLCTYLKNDKFYKKKMCIDAQNQIESILNIQDKLIKNKVSIAKSIKDGDLIYSSGAKGTNLLDFVIDLYNKKKYDEICYEYDKLYCYLKEHCGKKTSKKDNIFFKYNIETTKYNLDNLNFYEDGFLDITLSNIFVNNGKYSLIDQEWYEKNVPIEYILYRAIINFTCGIYNDIYEILMNRYNLVKYRDLFEKLETKIFEDVFSDTFKIMNRQYYNNYKIVKNLEMLKTDINMDYINEKNEYINSLENNINILNDDLNCTINDYKNLRNNYNELNNNYNELNNNYNELINNYKRIINSKGWKLIEKIRRVKNKLK